ncbi:MAG: UDP-N-acetylmuramate--L-alanine ligase [Deltaproteobacteria bacterium]|nr:UDP-N-acetylmuramate--L-alanine ligase [Deltaproteobacteria bacterium]
MIAVCGTGMGALACLLKDFGFNVTGSDQQVYPPISLLLENKGIPVLEGFDPDHITTDYDLVVVGNAVRQDNPEAARMRELNLPFCSMPQAINHFAGFGKKSLVIAGTHGKTTTSALLAWILFSAGFDPTYIIGGILKNFGTNYRVGDGPYMVLEGDEYDTAYFDKGPKFLHYDPMAAILTSIEFDHADIYSDQAAVRNAFDTFISGMSSQSTLVAFDQDPIIHDLIQNRPCRILSYGTDAGSAWRLGTHSTAPPWTLFDVMKNGGLWGRLQTRMIGEHNLWNALSAIAVADTLGISPPEISSAVKTFEGVKRRQEIRGCKNGITVMDDFAHHPTAVRETLRAVKSFYTAGRIIAVFEPRTNSSMRRVFQNDYPLSFDGADLVCIRNPPLLHKIPEEERFSSELLVRDLKCRGIDAHFFPDTEAIIDFLITAARPEDLVLIMSNGGFDQIHDRLLAAL